MKWTLIIMLSTFFLNLLTTNIYSNNIIPLPHLEVLKNQKKLYTIKFIDAKLIRNDHVGNEWAYYSEIENQKLYKGDELSINISDKQKVPLKIVVSETEEKYNDYKIEEIELTKNILDEYLKTGFFIDVVIKESNGRYAGNTATWRFYYEIEH